MLDLELVHGIAAVAELPPGVGYRLRAGFHSGVKRDCERRMADIRRGSCRCDGRAAFDVDYHIHKERRLERVVRCNLQVLPHVLTGLAKFRSVHGHADILACALYYRAACGIDHHASGRQRHLGVDQVDSRVVHRCDPEIAIAGERESRSAIVTAVRVRELRDYRKRLEVECEDHVRLAVVRHEQDPVGMPRQARYAHGECVGLYYRAGA